MLTMTRNLSLTDEPTIQIPVQVFMPVQEDTDWSCTFSIGWPDLVLERKTFGIDTIQSLELALRMVGTGLYASEYHKAGRLMWLKPRRGLRISRPQHHTRHVDWRRPGLLVNSSAKQNGGPSVRRFS